MIIINDNKYDNNKYKTSGARIANKTAVIFAYLMTMTLNTNV